MSTSARIYRVALIGCGDIAQTGHMPALLRHPRFKPVALCDTRPERTKLLSDMAGGLPTFSSHRDLLGRKDIDAVILALHPEISVDVAIAFLQDKKPILDEKPLATNLADGKRLVDAVAAMRGVYQIGFVFGYCDLVRTVAQYATRIGTPATYRVGVFDERLDRASTDHFQRMQQVLKHSSAMTHEGSHVVDFFHVWNMSPYVRAEAMAIKTEPDFNGPNVWSARLAVADGSVLAVDIGWLLPDYPPSSLTIMGPHGYLQMDLSTGRGEFLADGRTEHIQTQRLVQPWDRQLDTFAEAIDAGVSTVAPVQRGWNALVATQACQQAAATGQSVAL